MVLSFEGVKVVVLTSSRSEVSEAKTRALLDLLV